MEGTVDWEALKSGGYVLYGLASTIDSTFELTVMAKVQINENTDKTRNTGEARFYLPTGQFLPLCKQTYIVSFPFNVKEDMESVMEEFLSSYVEDVEPRMNYDSKETYERREFAMLQSIGMAAKQLKQMLAWEGVYYAAGTIVASAVIGTLFFLPSPSGLSPAGSGFAPTSSFSGRCWQCTRFCFC